MVYISIGFGWKRIILRVCCKTNGLSSSIYTLSGKRWFASWLSIRFGRISDFDSLFMASGKVYSYNADYGIPSGHPLVCCFSEIRWSSRWYGHLHIGQVLFSIYRGSNIVDLMLADTSVCTYMYTVYRCGWDEKVRIDAYVWGCVVR